VRPSKNAVRHANSQTATVAECTFLHYLTAVFIDFLKKCSKVCQFLKKSCKSAVKYCKNTTRFSLTFKATLKKCCKVCKFADGGTSVVDILTFLHYLTAVFTDFLKKCCKVCQFLKKSCKSAVRYCKNALRFPRNFRATLQKRCKVCKFIDFNFI
jgi:hypothetical protein